MTPTSCFFSTVMAHGGTDSLLLPALDAPDAGVQWVSVAKIVKVISDAGSISKQLRWSIKARLTSGDIMITLNTLTVSLFPMVASCSVCFTCRFLLEESFSC